MTSIIYRERTREPIFDEIRQRHMPDYSLFTPLATMLLNHIPEDEQDTKPDDDIQV